MEEARKNILSQLLTPEARERCTFFIHIFFYFISFFSG